MAGTVVLAFGGNALAPEGSTGSHEEQASNARAMAAAAAGLVGRGDRLVLTHGNGPQVGNLAIQQEDAADTVAPQPLSTLVAMTQGQIGHLIAAPLQARHPDLRGRVAAVVTHVRVDPSDPEFDAPTKPVGPFFAPDEAERLAAARGWRVAPVSGGSFRRVVPSPAPLGILELPAIRALVEAGMVVIATGGGGIPVVEQPDGELRTLDAVVDKDLSAACLATALGADRLALLTGVPEVRLDFGTSRERPVEEMTVDEAAAHHADGQFPPGSMGPKVTAATRFIKDGGSLAVITSVEHLAAALDGRHGTRIVPS